jgi:hypothetical protein
MFMNRERSATPTSHIGRVAMIGLLIVGLLTSGSHPAHAGGGDPDTAFKIAVAGVAVPSTMIGIGAYLATSGNDIDEGLDDGGLIAIGGTLLLFGPIGARWYAGEVGWRGFVGRFAGTTLIITGLLEFDLIDRCEHDATPEPACDDISGRGFAWGSTMTGAALVIAASAYDIIGAPRAVRDWNRRHAVVITPAGAPGSGGLSLTGRF